MAWSTPPDNRFYFFIRVQDDTLRLIEEDQKRWWNDDCIQITFDPDHSGGDFLGENVDQVLNAQRYHLRIKPLPGQPVAYNSLLEYIDLPPIGWSSDMFEGQPTGDIFEIAWTVNPPDAEHFSTNVSYTFEFRNAFWDIHGVTQDEAIRHIFENDQVTHIGVRPLDGDGGRDRCQAPALSARRLHGPRPEGRPDARLHPSWKPTNPRKSRRSKPRVGAESRAI